MDLTQPFCSSELASTLTSLLLDLRSAETCNHYNNNDKNNVLHLQVLSVSTVGNTTIVPHREIPVDRNCSGGK